MPLESIKAIPAEERWQAARWEIAGEKVSLDRIEHVMIRPVFNDPRIHFALVCAGRDCPPLRREAYTGKQLEAQLESQMQYVHSRAPWVRYAPSENQVALTPLYKWYGSDFVGSDESILPLVAKYNLDVAGALSEGGSLEIVWADYDWSLNQSEGFLAP